MPSGVFVSAPSTARQGPHDSFGLDCQAEETSGIDSTSITAGMD
jgi:hypothetical protein